MRDAQYIYALAFKALSLLMLLIIANYILIGTCEFKNFITLFLFTFSLREKKF